MIVKLVKQDDFVQYKKPCVVVCFPNCTWKCCTEAGIPTSVCQNQEMCGLKDIDVTPEDVYNLYKESLFAESICCSGLEPMLQFDDVLSLLKYFREHDCDADFVIYTGYYPEEIEPQLSILKQFSNIVLKCGRYIPNRPSKYDDILGITLASDNQYAKLVDFDQIKSS